MKKEPARYGERIRRLREERGLGLRELSRIADISPASLSAVENDQSSPTLATLHKILRALSTDFAVFFADRPAEPQQPVLPRSAMRVMEDAHRRYVLLNTRTADSRFQMVDETILPSERVGEWELHDFDMGGVVLEGGPLRLEIDGMGTWAVAEGDAFYVRAGWKHRGTNLGQAPLRMVTVADPPGY